MAHYNQSIRSYRKAHDVMERKGHRNYRQMPGINAVRLGYATFLVETPQGYAIRQHATDVVTYLHDMHAVLVTTGGWSTVSTLERLQSFTPSCISIRGRDIHSKKRNGAIFAEYLGTEYDLTDGDVAMIELRDPDVRYE